MADERTVAEQIRALFEELSTTQRVVVGAITLAVLLALLGLGFWANQEPMGVLFTQLSPQDANTIVERLKKDGVKYELSEDQKIISVPEKRVGDLRLRFAGEGLIRAESSVGFEKLEQPSITATDFSQRQMYLKAQERHLAVSIKSLQPVQDAVVHITPAKESVFLEESQGAKASVLLKLKGKGVLPEESVQSIVNLVSYAVEGLKPENVVVTDQYSHNYSKGKNDPLAGITDTQRKMQRTEEAHLVDQVVDLLEPVVGRGKVRAVARVELNFDKEKSSEEKFDPQGQVERSIQANEEKQEKRDAVAGVPGTPTNVAPANAAAGNTNPTETSTKKSTTTNFEISKSVSSVEKAPGSVRRLSVAVMVDHASQWEKDAKGNPSEKLVPRTPEELKKLKDQVSAAVGLQASRGDEITVENMPFTSATTPKEEAEASKERIWELVWRFGPILVWTFVGAILFYFVVLPILKRINAVLNKPVPISIPSEEDMAKKPPIIKTMAEMEAEIEAEIEASAVSSAPEAKRREIIKRKVQEVTIEDPESAASLLRSWILEDKG